MAKRPEDACKHIGIDDSKSKSKRVLETVVDEIDLQMDEETVKRIMASLIEIGAVLFSTSSSFPLGSVQ